MSANIDPFRWEIDDPLAVEHQLFREMISEILPTMKSRVFGTRDIDLTATTNGQRFLEMDAEAGCRLVMASILHLTHLQRFCHRFRELGDRVWANMNEVTYSEWNQFLRTRAVAVEILRHMMRRKLPLTRDHFIALAKWFSEEKFLTDQSYPLKVFLKALDAFGRIDSQDIVLRNALDGVLKTLSGPQTIEGNKAARRLRDLLAKGNEISTIERSVSEFRKPTPIAPAPVGSNDVLVELKQYLGVIDKGPSGSPGRKVGLDLFFLRADSPLQDEHELITLLLPEVVERPRYYEPDLRSSATGKKIWLRDGERRTRLVLALAERCSNIFLTEEKSNDHRFWQSQHALLGLLSQLIAQNMSMNREHLFDILLYLSAVKEQQWHGNDNAVWSLVKRVEALDKETLSNGELHVLHRLRCWMVNAPPLGRLSDEVALISKLIGDGMCFALVPGEAWSDAVNEDLSGMKSIKQTKWLNILRQASSATGSRASAKWLKMAREQVKEVGAKNFTEALLRWFPLVNNRRTVPLLGGELDINGTIHADNLTCLRGLLWMIPDSVSAAMIRTVGALTASCYRKVAGVGPRAVKAANAGVFALSQMDDPLALGQLALLKIKVKFGSAQKEIEKAFNAAAERSGLPREELEEMSVPTYGLTEVGEGVEEFGDFSARLKITGTDSTEIEWSGKDGKRLKSVPSVVKEKFGKEWKEFQGQVKDIQKMLPAQRERLDGMFLAQRVWPVGIWRERYLEHPLIGTLARRILWEFSGNAECKVQNADCKTGMWFEGRMVDLDLREIELKEGMSARLWHPVGKELEEVLAWRGFLEAQGIQQPFKQAHREIYLLTDAELRTGTYSNRFAAHILKQHQFNALCAARGWKNQLRLMVDAEYAPPCLNLPQWGLRAEFWVEGIGENYGTDTTDSGAFLRLATDQVRFYRVDAIQRTAHAGGGGYHPNPRREDAEPVALQEIPALVFSEVMRDVDLFVGVASVGNDPTWSDGGPDGRYQAYWQDYSFGKLNESAKTRKDVLQRLVPKLKIAKVCSFTEKFLVVKGSLRTYRIHLGSGNILMEPNDQYLCIVPKQSSDAATEGGVMLPFEGDRTLSVILSKAFMLAEDAKIKDTSIVNQIGMR